MPTYLTTRQCADYLGVTSEHVRGEIVDGRLLARVRMKVRRRTVYRVELTDFRAYCQQHSPNVVPLLPAEG
jgi:hypothetical protein